MSGTRDVRARSNAGRREELVEAAIRVVARDGVAAATTRKIADESGLPLGTVHYWFASKEQLLEEVLQETMRRMAGAIEEVSAATPGDADLFDEFRAAWGVAVDDPDSQLALYELTCLALRTPGMRALAERQYALYRETARHSVERWLERSGATVPGGPSALATLVAAAMDGLVLAWLADPEGTDVEAAFRVLTESLRAQALASA